MNERVLFVRVGWMKWYNGSQPGDKRPIGRKGRYKGRVVSWNEPYNFSKLNDRCYGDAQVSTKKPRTGYTLQRIDPACKKEDRLKNVLVVFVAPDQSRSKLGLVIIGWYKNATVFRTKERLESTPRRKYSFFCSARDALLLPVDRRRYQIPTDRKEGAFGQHPTRYTFKEGGKREKRPWMEKAVRFVRKYKGPNAVQDSLSRSSKRNIGKMATRVEENQDSLSSGDEKNIARYIASKSQGFGRNAAEIEAIEDHAMAVAEKHFKRNGYPICNDHSGNQPYDYLCEKKSGEQLFVEVKGTKGDGSKVIVTPGEVKHARQHPKNSVLFICHGIKVHYEDKKPVATGGKKCKFDPPWPPKSWPLVSPELRPISFFYYTDPESSKAR